MCSAGGLKLLLSIITQPGYILITLRGTFLMVQSCRKCIRWWTSFLVNTARFEFSGN